MTRSLYTSILYAIVIEPKAVFSKPAQLNALAYTQGQDIHVGPGQEKHLPHEGWHAVQQMQGRVTPTMQAKGVSINDDAGLEREADVIGTKALQMTPVSIKQRRGHHERSTALQRQVVTKGESEVQRQPGELKDQVQSVLRAFARAVIKGDDPSLFEFRNELLDDLYYAQFYLDQEYGVLVAKSYLISAAKRVKEKQEELISTNFYLAQELRAAGNIADWILQAWEPLVPSEPQYDDLIESELQYDDPAADAIKAMEDIPGENVANWKAAGTAATKVLDESVNLTKREFWIARLDPSEWTNVLPFVGVVAPKIPLKSPKAPKSVKSKPAKIRRPRRHAKGARVAREPRWVDTKYGRLLDPGYNGRLPRFDPPAGFQFAKFKMSKSNLNKMLRGQPPKGPDGKPVILHHREQGPMSHLDEYTTTAHNKLGLHEKGKDYSEIDRPVFELQKARHWVSRARKELGIPDV